MPFCSGLNHWISFLMEILTFSFSDEVKSAAREDQENQAKQARASHLHPLPYIGSLINAAEQ